MLIDFFYTLRAAKLPVSVKEYLTLLEALQADVVGPRNPDACTLDDFYYLSRTALVKAAPVGVRFDRARDSEGHRFPEFRAWHAILPKVFGITVPNWREPEKEQRGLFEASVASYESEEMEEAEESEEEGEE